jgi:hypothetical protein
MSAPFVSNITINKGDDFSQVFHIKTFNDLPLDLTDYTAASSIRKHPESSKKEADFIVSFVNNEQGEIKISLASSITTLIKSGRYVYDILVTDNAGFKKITVEGSISVRSGISTICL